MSVRSVDFMGIDNIVDTGLTTAMKRITFNLTLKYTTDDGVKHQYGPALKTFPNDLATMPLAVQKAFAIKMVDAFVRVSLGISTWEDFS